MTSRTAAAVRARRCTRRRSSFDCRLFFVGSMNLDPRSAFTNTEIGIIVDAPAEAAHLCGVLDDVLAHSYRVALRATETGGSRIEWSGLDGGREVRYTTSPKTSAWQRFKSTFYGLLPIEPLHRSYRDPPRAAGRASNTAAAGWRMGRKDSIGDPRSALG